ncbi:MAG: hypothetical protein IJS32_08465 [Kiritimatiellae bacterium]|nr:hypothetical protein [Kiritimatiellia bacterium]
MKNIFRIFSATASFLLLAGCSLERPEATIDLASRHAHVHGFDLAAGKMVWQPDYDREEVYSVPATIERVRFEEARGSLSGFVWYAVAIGKAPDGCPFREGERVLLYGAADDAACVDMQPGAQASLLFFRETNEFADFRQETEASVPRTAPPERSGGF